VSDMEERRPFPPGVGDPYGRELMDVRREAELAMRAVEMLDEVIALGRSLTRGREAGERLFQRLGVSRTTIARIAQRDLEIAEELEAFLAGHLDWVAAHRAGTTRLTPKLR
jgi:hypothetical protein